MVQVVQAFIFISTLDPRMVKGERVAIRWLAELASRVLVVPATYAHFERLFSSAGNVAKNGYTVVCRGMRTKLT